MSIEIILTADGSHTLRNSEINDTYHSIHGATQESRYVFINAGLEHKLTGKPPKINILEVGFGTGLNAYPSLLHQDHIKVDYTALESFPLGEKIYSLPNYSKNSILKLVLFYPCIMQTGMRKQLLQIGLVFTRFLGNWN